LQTLAPNKRRLSSALNKSPFESPAMRSNSVVSLFGIIFIFGQAANLVSGYGQLKDDGNHQLPRITNLVLLYVGSFSRLRRYFFLTLLS